MDLYFLKRTGSSWELVDKAAFIDAESAAGFRNKHGRPDEPATGGFGAPRASGVVISPAYFVPSDYDSRPDLRDLIIATIASRSHPSPDPS